jgi:hypothetical protein
MSTGLAAIAVSFLLLPTGGSAPPGSGGDETQVPAPAFHRPTDAELAGAKSELLRAAADVEETLRKSPDGALIAEEIGLAKLKTLCQSDRLNLAFLEAIYRTVSDGAVGREQQHLVRLRAAVTQCATLLRARTSAHAEKEFNRQLRELREARETFGKTGSETSLARIRTAYAWLVDHGQAADLQKAVNRGLSHPNVWVWLDHQVVNDMMPPPTTEPVTINKSVDGVNINGQGQFTGSGSLSYRPDSSAATVRATIVGHGENSVSASRGRATVYGHSTAEVHATQLFHLTADGLSSDPADISVDANYSPDSANFAAKRRFMRRLGGKIALRAANKQRPKATEDMRQEVSREVEGKMQKEVVAFINKQNEVILEKYRLPMARWDMPCALAASTEERTLRIAATLGRKTQLGAPRLPPVAAGQNALNAAMHDSAVNNLHFALAGRNIAEDEFQELMFRTLGLEPKDGMPKRSGAPARIRLAQESPLSVAFKNGAAEVTLRIQEFRGLGKEGSGKVWTAKTRYVPKITPAGVEVDRVDPISIDPEQGESSRDLREVLAGFLVGKATSQGLTTTGELAKMAHLRVHSLDMRDGWLLITMKPAPKTESASANATVSNLSATGK